MEAWCRDAVDLGESIGIDPTPHRDFCEAAATPFTFLAFMVSRATVFGHLAETHCDGRSP